MLTYYHYTLTPDDNGTLLIQFPDIPEAAAVAQSEAEAPAQAADGLEAALQMYIDAHRPLPASVFVSDTEAALEVWEQQDQIIVRPVTHALI